MKLICPNCHARYERGKYCIECGTPLVELVTKKVLFCPECKLEYTKGKFCPECGAKLEEREIEVVDSATKTTVDVSVTNSDKSACSDFSKRNRLPMDEIRKSAEASYPKESLKALAIAVLKIAEVIQERLPEADVSYRVHPSSFDSTCSADALPIHFLFKKNGIPKVAVVAVTQYGFRATNVQKTAKCCEKNGIAYVRVYANGSFADWIQGWSEFSPYGPDNHGPVSDESVEFCKNWLVEQVTKNL